MRQTERRGARRLARLEFFGGVAEGRPAGPGLAQLELVGAVADGRRGPLLGGSRRGRA